MRQVQVFFYDKALRAKCLWDFVLLTILRIRSFLCLFVGRRGDV